MAIENLTIPRLTVQEYREKFDRTRVRQQTERDNIWNQHVALFQELGQLGIIGLLEEITQEKFHLEKTDGKMMYWFDRPWEDKWWENQDYQFSSDYKQQLSFDIVSPYLRIDTETWIHDAKFILSKLELPYGGRKDGIILSYSPKKILQVTGQKIKFKDSLPQEKNKRISTVRSAIDKALQNRLKGTSLLWAICPRYKVDY